MGIIGTTAVRDKIRETLGRDICTHTARSWIIQGIIPGNKAGRDWVVDEEELDKVLADPHFQSRLPRPGPGDNTTEKHKEIRELLDEGLSYNAIAHRLKVSPGLVSLVKNGYVPK